jgi:hypothetical protein
MRHRLSHVLTTAALAALAAPAGAQSLSGRPFRTESATTFAWGLHVLDVGVEAMDGAVPVPLLDDTGGELVRVPVVRYRLGLGRAELDIGGPAWQLFDPDHPTREDEDEVGDLELFFKVGLLREAPGRPSLGVSVAARLPNASEETGLGSDETDVFAAFLLSKEWDVHEIRLNVGLAILGDPLEDGSQEDLATYGLAGRHGERHCFIWEAWGRALESDDERDLTESTLRLGYAYWSRRVTADVAVLVGLDETSGDLGLAAGASWLFGQARR